MIITIEIQDNVYTLEEYEEYEMYRMTEQEFLAIFTFTSFLVGPVNIKFRHHRMNGTDFYLINQNNVSKITFDTVLNKRIEMDEKLY
jgi:hypothetical protein